MSPESPPAILIIDDEPGIRRNCVNILSGPGRRVDAAAGGQEGLKLLESHPYPIVITDLKMDRMGGMAVLEKVRETRPETLVIVMTGFASVSSAVEVMKKGAYDYLPKPFTPQELRAVVEQAANHYKIRMQHQTASPADPGPVLSHQLIGDSPKILEVVAMIRKAAPTDATVLISGESGTGKELVARALHANSLRKNQVFFAVDCGTLSGNLLESELFGYKKGAFTNAISDKAGIFQVADKGTVFLDEISNISIEVQGRLLRFLDSREFLPLGGAALQKVDIRLIFASNRDLKQMVREGAFRNDFYYRINVYPIHIPPLRERKEDIIPIANHFLNRFNKIMGKSIQGFDDAALARLMAHDWPGNVRQLRNTVERAVILCDGDRIGTKDLPQHTGESVSGEWLADPAPLTALALKQAKKQVREIAVQRLEEAFIRRALEAGKWNITRAARATGMQRTHFHALMKKHGVRAPKQP